MILAGQLIQIANEKVPKPAPAPAPARVRPQPEARVNPAKPAPVALHKPLNHAPLAWAIFFVPVFWLLISETFFSTLETAHRPFDFLWNRLAPLIECNSQVLADLAVKLAFLALQTVAIVIPSSFLRKRF